MSDRFRRTPAVACAVVECPVLARIDHSGQQKQIAPEAPWPIEHPRRLKALKRRLEDGRRFLAAPSFNNRKGTTHLVWRCNVQRAAVAVQRELRGIYNHLAPRHLIGRNRRAACGDIFARLRG